MPGEERKMALFSQYAMAAASEALDDAGWKPSKEEDLEATVCSIQPVSFSGLQCAIISFDIRRRGSISDLESEILMISSRPL